MYGIFTYIYLENRPNVGKYTIHGSYGDDDDDDDDDDAGGGGGNNTHELSGPS